MQINFEQHREMKATMAPVGFVPAMGPSEFSERPAPGLAMGFGLVLIASVAVVAGMAMVPVAAVVLGARKLARMASSR